MLHKREYVQKPWWQSSQCYQQGKKGLNESISFFILLFSKFKPLFKGVLTVFDDNSSILNNVGLLLIVAVASSMKKKSIQVLKGLSSQLILVFLCVLAIFEIRF